ncbi:hypothetical protein Tco_1145564 [Tanacetum coccineum]
MKSFKQQWDDLSSILNLVVLSSSKDRLPTRVNLSRRGVLLDSHLCPLCNAVVGFGLAGDLFFLGLGCLVLILSTFFPSQVYFRRCFLCCLVADLEASKSVGL